MVALQCLRLLELLPLYCFLGLRNIAVLLDVATSCLWPCPTPFLDTRPPVAFLPLSGCLAAGLPVCPAGMRACHEPPCRVLFLRVIFRDALGSVLYICSSLPLLLNSVRSCQWS